MKQEHFEYIQPTEKSIREDPAPSQNMIGGIP